MDTAAHPTAITLAQATPSAPSLSLIQRPQPWMISSGLLLLLAVGLGVYSQIQMKRLKKDLKFETYKNRELKKKIKMALSTISKMERNPDLVHSREFNLDYLRLRMDEELFHFAIVNQLKVKVKQELSTALRSRPEGSGMVGIASKPRQINQIFDVKYRPHDRPEAPERVLFRIQIQLAKLPTQSTSSTIAQIIECIENFLSPEAEDHIWQPTIQGRIAQMHWDQKAKPTPLLVLAQSNDGVNVTLRSKNRLA
jgi:hypothetical protein